MEKFQTIKRPFITEKGTLLREGSNKYLFEVDIEANKFQIKTSIEKLFNVHVEQVRTLRMRGKTRRVGKNIGRKSNFKKAYISLREGEKIDLFEGV
jgi:large subunit ribosomal protein L23